MADPHLVAMIFVCLTGLSAYGGIRATCSIPFEGVASGGQLILAETLNRNVSYVILQTAEKETASSVAQRLAEAINQANPFGWAPPGDDRVTAGERGLEGLLGDSSSYMLSGTERGLGIPEPPHFLTANYDRSGTRASFRWANPSGGYDRIILLLKWDNNLEQDTLEVSGTAEEWTLDLDEQPWYAEGDIFSDLDFWVIGFAAGIPSNAAAIHVSHNTQEELFGIPFAGGTAPNWAPYSASGRTEKAAAMGISEDLTASQRNPLYNPIRTRGAKPFYQIILGDKSGNATGVSREFLGLTPGHTYRLSVRLNTLQAPKEGVGWTYSLHAIPTNSESRLNAKQLAGMEALPNGKKGENAARIAKYDHERTTKGKYEEFGTDITLPPGKDSITVWLKLKGGKTDMAVAMDYIRLEDLVKYN